MLGNNWLALLVTLIIALAWLRINDLFAHKGWVGSSLSRKIIHIGTGFIFVLCWLFFDTANLSRFFAAVVPTLILIQFGLVGLGVIKDQSSVDAMSRTGDRKEILRGPLFYGIAFVVLTLVYWKDSVIGIVGLMMLCGGDGFADIIGNKLGKRKLPWSKEKSLAGTSAMFLGSLLFSCIVLGIYYSCGVFQGSLLTILPSIFVICFVGALVESLPFADIDNLTVPLIAVLLGWLLGL